MNDTTYYDITTSCKKKTNKQTNTHCIVVSNTKPCSKLGGTTLNFERVTSSGLK